MIEIKNLRIENMGNNWTRAVADIDFIDMKNPYDESCIWFATRNDNRDMLTDESYNAFLLVPLYLAMYHKQDLHICGRVSKRLYKNIITYMETILCEFSDHLSKVNVFVDGYTNITKKGELIGAGISCGVDSLSTIYDHYIKENDADYKINALFLFNCGTHGDYDNPQTIELYKKRYELNKQAADEMGLAVYQVDSNLHAFARGIGVERIGYLAIWSCVLALEKSIKKYYVSSTYEYEEIKTYSKYTKDFDMAEFCESYLIPLIETENLELTVDGCQYRRTQKTENIAEWEIAQKYLNVCINPIDGSNCSKCTKCMRTLLPLDAMGKLDKFSGVFNLDTYRKYQPHWKCYFVANTKKIGFANDIVNYCITHGYSMPPAIIAMSYMFLRKCASHFKKILKS